MRKILDRFLFFVDSTNELVGRVFALLIPAVMLITSYEVFMRYLFRAPTIWAWDINKQLLALIVLLGGGYVLLHDGHVRVDVIYVRLPARWKAILNLITSPVFFIFLGILLWKFVVMTLNSIADREVTDTLFAPPVYPLKIVCSIGIFLYLMEGVARFIRNLRIALGKKTE